MKIDRITFSISALRHWLSCFRFRRPTAYSLQPAAFTLVELMVVVVIIAMLIMLVMPQLHNARNRARSAKCQNNLRQYGVAVNQYISDWSGYFLMPSSGGTDARGIGSGTQISTEIGLRDYEAEHYSTIIDGGGSLGGSVGHSVQGFITMYISTNTYPNIEGTVTHCPEADLDVLKTNSSVFKGRTRDQYGRMLNDNYGVYTTYGANADQDQKLRSDIPDQAISFADWNVAQGWNAYIKFETSTWAMAKSSVGPEVQGLYGEQDEVKNAPGYLTELGFRHKLGKKYFANYVCFDGHVGSVDFPDNILATMSSTGKENVRKGYFSDLGPNTVTASVESNFYRVFYGVDKP